jgi:hypothetical protein
VTLELCTVYKEMPYGLAIIDYKQNGDTLFSKDKSEMSFKGVGIFKEGILH